MCACAGKPEKLGLSFLVSNDSKKLSEWNGGIATSPWVIMRGTESPSKERRKGNGKTEIIETGADRWRDELGL